MRGKLLDACVADVDHRIIPAHAGQTDIDEANARRKLRDGSSPRMRGKHGGRHDRDLPARIIPAHAGQTAVMPPDVFRNPDHPRACGANDSDRGGGVRCRGSSPRMRGKQIVIGERVLNIRIIPAHAGQT